MSEEVKKVEEQPSDKLAQVPAKVENPPRRENFYFVRNSHGFVGKPHPRS